MRIVVCTSVVPFVLGGGRNIVEWLEQMLRADGHEVERLYLPSVDAPDLLFQQMAAYRWIDLSSADRIICFRPPSHLIPHPKKVLWFIHHIRTFYDMWDSEHRPFPNDLKHRGIREALHAADTAALNEAHAIYANSRVVADRLRAFNGVSGEVLYPPIFQPERFHRGEFNDSIVSVCRVVPHKRQHLLIDAMRFTKSRVKLRLYGASLSPGYSAELHKQILDADVSDKVTFEDRWISEEEKAGILADCLAMAYPPEDEDSYGYPTLEAAHSWKPTLTTDDAGGVLEFVEDRVTGVVAQPDPRSLADAMDMLYAERPLARQLGENAHARIDEMNISWPHVISRVLA